MNRLIVIVLLQVEASFKEQEAVAFSDGPSLQGLLPPSVDKVPKSLKECSECNKTFK